MTKKVKMPLEIASIMHQGTNSELREFAIKHFPELEMKITDRVKTLQDASNIIGQDLNPEFFINLRPHEIARRKIEIITEALNEGWKPNWDNSTEGKYYPWFRMSSSGSGFAFDDFLCDDAISDVGSRLVFKTRELAEYAGKQFVEIYKEMFTL
jgi:hypothetical protein